LLRYPGGCRQPIIIVSRTSRIGPWQWNNFMYRPLEFMGICITFLVPFSGDNIMFPRFADRKIYVGG
jgi:hypothetical protein